MRLKDSTNGRSDNILPTQSTDQSSYLTTSQLDDQVGDSQINIEEHSGIDNEVDTTASIVHAGVLEPDAVKPITRQRSSRYGIALGIFLSVALLGGGSYFYWRTYEASLNKILTADKLYQQGCQPSEWTNTGTIESANKKLGQAKELLQQIPNFPGFGYENAQNSLAKISQCSQQLQSANNTISYHLGLAQQVQNLVNDVVKLSEQLSPHLGYQAYSTELQKLQDNLQAFEQSTDFAYIQNQESLVPLKRSLAALRKANDDFGFAYDVWSYCQAENACFRSTRTSEEFLPTSSNPIPDVAAALINHYGLTSEQPMGWLLVVPRNGIPLNKALNRVWYFAKQDLQEAQLAINEELAYLQGNPQ